VVIIVFVYNARNLLQGSGDWKFWLRILHWSSDGDRR